MKLKNSPQCSEHLIMINCSFIIRDEFPNVLKVKYGKNVWNDTSIGWSEVEELIPHENYFNFEDDIGLIKLKNEIVFNKNVQPVKLPTSDNIDSKFTAVAIGWGILRVSRVLLFLLFYVYISLLIV